MEEANARIQNMSLFSVFSIPHISQVYMMYRGELDQGYASAGLESLEVDLFHEQDIPWNELAFPVMRETLKLYYADKKAGRFYTHNGDILRVDDRLIINLY